MPKDRSTVFLHIRDKTWLETPKGDLRGYIDAGQLKECWFHTGTNCNLSCPFCLEGSRPGDERLQMVSLDDVRPFIDEAVALGVSQLSFTGGEPFINKAMLDILDYALDKRPCMILTNGTKPLHLRLTSLKNLLNHSNELSFRVSFDHPDPDVHDLGRGEGSFMKALEGMKELHTMGFKVSIARHMQADENKDEVDGQYQKWIKQVGIEEPINIVGFPDFLTPGSTAEIPLITEDCMTRYHTEETRSQFMCAFSRMIVKQNDQMKVFACTLVDDDEDYNLGRTLSESLQVRTMLRHHRCFSCFKYGASCSES